MSSPGAVYLAIHVVSIALFSLGYKIAERRQGCDTAAVLLVMYVAAVASSGPMAAFTEGFAADWRLIAVGLGGGIALFVAMRTFFLAMAQGGLAIGWTFVSLAVVIPVVASIGIWQEIPNAWQVVGLCLMIPCILLFGDLHLSIRGSARRWIVLVAAASVFTGVTQLANKVAGRIPVPLADGSVGTGAFNFITWMFASGAVCLAVAGGWRKCRLLSAEMATGIAMGLLNVLGTWAFVKALETLPGIVFFPMKAIFGVVLTAALAVFFWRERITPRQFVGILVGGLSVVLVNVR